SVGNSPRLFAATHVLHRLSAPRHPPHALSSLLTSISSTPLHKQLRCIEIEVQDPRSSRRTREIRLKRAMYTSGPLNSSQQKLNSTLRMHFSLNDASIRRQSFR